MKTLSEEMTFLGSVFFLNFSFLILSLLNIFCIVILKSQIDHKIYFTASIPLAAMAICCVLGGVLGEQVGRKRMILVVAPVLGIGYIVQGVAKDPGLLNTGRFISGVAGGLACGPGAVNHKIFATCQK